MCNGERAFPEVFKSEIDFDYLEFGIQQKLSLGTAGITSYTVKTGDFFNRRELRLIDYKFQRKGDPLFFNDPNTRLPGAGFQFCRYSIVFTRETLYMNLMDY